jgi:ComF family protein
VGKTEALRAALTLTGNALVGACLAPLCACCHRTLESPLGGPVCPQCWEDARAADGRYDGALREIIHAMKYDGRRSLARPLAALLRDRHHAALAGARSVVPVPLFPWRRLRRGFNQAADLAVQLELPVVHALWRVRSTPPQTGLTAAQRRRNVRGAFCFSPLVSRTTRARYIADQIVVLVDDVMTTGATSGACAEVLAEAGAREVRIVTLARA